MHRTKIQSWKDKFMPRLKKIHKNFAEKIFHRLMKKSATLKSSLKRRSKEYEVTCRISLDEIRHLFLQAYGRKCKYCERLLVVSNLVCDHIKPLSDGGNSYIDNLQIICDRCNRRKGPLTHKQYASLLKFLGRIAKPAQDYILRKLSKSDVMGG